MQIFFFFNINFLKFEKKLKKESYSKNKLLNFLSQRCNVNNHNFPIWNNEVYQRKEFYFQEKEFIDHSFNMNVNNSIKDKYNLGIIKIN